MACRGGWAWLAAIILLPAQPALAEWQEAKSPHFIVYANDKPDRIRAFMTRLEKFDRAMRVLFGVADTGESSSLRLTIYVVDNEDDVANLAGKGGSGVAGFYRARANGAVAFVPRKSNQDTGSDFDLKSEIVLLHEYTHHFTASNWPNLAVPPWFSEGFAEFNATALFNKDGGVTMGSPPLYRATEILDPSMPMKRIISANLDDLSLEKKVQVYGRGWLLTHYILLNSERRKLFQDYLTALNSGKSPIEAAAVFGDLDALDRELNRYAAKRLQGFTLKPQDFQIGQIDVVPLSAGAAAVMPVWLLSERGVNKSLAPKVYALAQKLAAPFPDDPTAQGVLAEAAYDADQLDAAKAAAARAIAADPKNFHALIYKGRVAMAIAMRDHLSDSATWDAVRASFLAANKIDTENAEPLLLFYQSFVVTGAVPTKNAQAALAYAYQLAPFDRRLRMSAAIMFLNQKKAEEAREALGPVAYDPHGGALAEIAKRALAALAAGDSAAALGAMRGNSPAAGGNADGDGDTPNDGASGGPKDGAKKGPGATGKSGGQTPPS